MNRILRIDCSPKGAEAHSTTLADELTARLVSQHPGAHVMCRNIGEAPPACIDAPFAAAMRAHQSGEEAKGVAALAQSEVLIGELEASDALIIATPMHNFTVPASLKAWIDQVVRFGRTFRSTPEGKIGLLTDRPTFVIVAAGGYFLPPRAVQPDFLTAYLASILATLGIRDVTLIPMEGLNRGEAAVADAYRDARAVIAVQLAS